MMHPAGLPFPADAARTPGSDAAPPATWAERMRRGPVQRYAVACLPAPSLRLHQLGIDWLAGCASEATAPWQRQFHAALRPALRLRADRSEADLLALAGRLAAQTPAPPWPALVLDALDDRIVLRADGPLPAGHALRQLADRCVREFDSLRAPATLLERALQLTPGRRRVDHERDLLAQRWGHGDVFHRWRFQITLSERLPTKLRQAAWRLAQAHFGRSVWRGLHAEGLAVLQQAGPNKPWCPLALLRFKGA